jgi:uncharacterized OsmC-like protein
MKMLFNNGFNGKLKVRENSLNINSKAFLPYDLTVAGLASCLYSTFLDTLDEEGLTIINCEIDSNYHKKNEYPYTLDKVEIKFLVKSKESTFNLRSALTKASENCSMFYTIAQVSKIELQLDIRPKLSIKLF